MPGQLFRQLVGIGNGGFDPIQQGVLNGFLLADAFTGITQMCDQADVIHCTSLNRFSRTLFDNADELRNQIGKLDGFINLHIADRRVNVQGQKADLALGNIQREGGFDHVGCPFGQRKLFAV